MPLTPSPVDPGTRLAHKEEGVMSRRMEENTYDNLTGDQIRTGLVSVVMMVDRRIFTLDLTNESAEKFDEMITPILAQADFRGTIDDLDPEQMAQLIAGSRKVEIGGDDDEPQTDSPVVPNTPDQRQRMTNTAFRGKFTDDQVREIRKARGPVALLAHEWGVSSATIYNIKNRKSYPNVK